MEKKLTVHQAAALLDIPEATVSRWVRQGKIPAVRANNDTFLVESQLRAWARAHNMSLKERTEVRMPDVADQQPSLSEAMERGGVLFDVKGDSVEAVLEEVVKEAPLPPEIDRGLVLERLLQREELASTGIGEGVAIPHPRYPLENLPVPAMVTTGLLEQEVDFHSVDGKPVFVVFMVLCSTTKLHLKLLARLSFCVRDHAFLSWLRGCRSAEELLSYVRKLEGTFRT